MDWTKTYQKISTKQKCFVVFHLWQSCDLEIKPVIKHSTNRLRFLKIKIMHNLKDFTSTVSVKKPTLKFYWVSKMQRLSSQNKLGCFLRKKKSTVNGPTGFIKKLFIVWTWWQELTEKCDSLFQLFDPPVTLK